MNGSSLPRLIAAATTTAIIVSHSNTALGAGFAIKEQSTTAQGNAFAGATAGADDISYMFFNPAGLTRHQDSQVLSSLSYILPTSEAKDVEGTTATDAEDAEIEGGSNTGDIGEDALVPALYALWAMTPDLRFGVGLTAPFGLTTDNDEDFAGRYHGTRSELKTVNLNPVVAYQMTDWLSVGAGLQVQYLETQLQNAIDFGTIGAAEGGTPGSLADDGAANLRGDDFAFGFNVGAMLDTWEGGRIGFAYRSEISHNVEGNVDFDLGGAIGQAVSGASGAFVTTDATANVTTPAVASVGLHQDINQEWAVMGEVAWTDWSQFNELRIEFDNPNQDDSVTVEDWEDSMFFALGATYRPQAVEGLTLRLGLAYDQTPIPAETRTPRVPGSSRYWVSTGLAYRPTETMEFNLSYTHIFVDDGNVDLSIADDANNQARGDLTATYEQHIDIISISGRISFWTGPGRN